MRINIEEMITRQQKNEQLRQEIISQDDHMKSLDNAISTLQQHLSQVKSRGLNYEEASALLSLINGYCTEFGLDDQPQESDLERWVGTAVAADTVNAAIEQLTENLAGLVNQRMEAKA